MNDDSPRLFSPNWIGVEVEDFDASFLYYTQGFGIPPSNVKPDWAHIGASARQRMTMKCPGMMFELFGAADPHYQQSWRPWIMSTDPEAIIGRIGANATDTFCPGFGEGWAVTAPEGVRWAISKSTNAACLQDLYPPLVIGVEMPVVNLEQMRDFYVDTFGLDPIQTDPDTVMLVQGANMPYLVFVRAPQPPPVFPYNPTLVPSDTKLSLSIQVSSIEEAAPIVKASGATITTPVLPHEYGIDMNFLDPEGNPLQIVQYAPWP